MLTCDKCKRGKPGDGVHVDRNVPVRWGAGESVSRTRDRRSDLCNDCAVKLITTLGKTVSDFFGET